MNYKKRVTIKDVARLAGVSKQTVSRVINDRPDVSQETRQRVKEVINLLGYRPDPIARSMKGGTQTIGCVTPNLTDYNFACIVEGAQHEARKNGYFLLTGCASTGYEVAPLLQEMMNRRVDGLIVINPREENRHQLFRPFIDQGIPVVYLKNSPQDEPVYAVCLDDKKGGYLAGQYLFTLGHRTVINIMGPQNEQCSQDRLYGFTKSFDILGERDYTILSVQGDWSADSGEKCIEDLINKSTQFTAIFAQNDRMAIGSIRALRKAGLKVPHDISVIGYDDHPLASFFNPPLTTIRQPFDQFGKLGIGCLINHIDGTQSKPETIVLEPELVIRSSCHPHIR